MTTVRRVRTQDLEPDPTTGQRRIRRGSRAIGSPRSAARRHRRETKTRPFTGFKRHVLTWIDTDLIVDAVVRPAYEPEHLTLATVTLALATHGPLGDLFIDRGYLASATVPALHAAGVTIRAKAWTSANRGRLPKQAFAIDVARAEVTCQAGERVAIAAGATAVHFAAATCQACPQRDAAHARQGRTHAGPRAGPARRSRALQRRPQEHPRLAPYRGGRQPATYRATPSRCLIRCSVL